MRTRFIATLSIAALLTLGLPGVASASCTEVFDGTGCIENTVCAAFTVVKQVDCVQ
jgi:hypothetical protein